MKQLNEVKRMQQLAGIISESQLNELDASLLSGIAKNLYLYLGKMKPNNPLDVNGDPLKNIKGEPITYNKKVTMTYQNPELGKQGKAKELGKVIQGNVITSNPEVTVSYYGSIILVGDFVKKEEAESALKYILDKYPNQLTGLNGEPTVRTHKMDYEWAKNHAPRYNFELRLKDDKAVAKSQSAKPSNESLEEAPSTPSDVAALSKAQASSTAVASKSKNINSATEFPGAFETWFQSLGFQPGKINKSTVRSQVDQVLTKLGYK